MPTTLPHLPILLKNGVIPHMNKALRDACRTPLESERVRPRPQRRRQRQQQTYMKAIEEPACPRYMCIGAGRAHAPHIPVFNLDTPAAPVRKVGLGDVVKVREEVPAPRLLALPRGVLCDRVRGRDGVAVVLAVFVAWYDGPHDDVQWDACVADAECAFEDDLTLEMDRLGKALSGGKKRKTRRGEGTMYVP